MRYNGWVNYETWNINLWYGDTFKEDAVAFLEAADGDRVTATEMLAGHIRLTVADWAPDLGSSPFGDLLAMSLSEVDYWELAESYIAEIQDAE